jgi:hypothetical protein
MNKLLHWKNFRKVGRLEGKECQYSRDKKPGEEEDLYDKRCIPRVPVYQI